LLLSELNAANQFSIGRGLHLEGPPVSLFLISTVVSVGVAPAPAVQVYVCAERLQDSLHEQLLKKRQQNAIARMVQQTKPQFLQEFRRVINNFTTARELLPSVAEISNVMDSIHKWPTHNGVRVTMF